MAEPEELLFGDSMPPQLGGNYFGTQTTQPINLTPAIKAVPISCTIDRVRGVFLGPSPGGYWSLDTGKGVYSIRCGFTPVVFVVEYDLEVKLTDSLSGFFKSLIGTAPVSIERVEKFGILDSTDPFFRELAIKRDAWDLFAQVLCPLYCTDPTDVAFQNEAFREPNGLVFRKDYVDYTLRWDIAPSALAQLIPNPESDETMCCVRVTNALRLVHHWKQKEWLDEYDLMVFEGLGVTLEHLSIAEAKGLVRVQKIPHWAVRSVHAWNLPVVQLLAQPIPSINVAAPREDTMRVAMRVSKIRLVGDEEIMKLNYLKQNFIDKFKLKRILVIHPERRLDALRESIWGSQLRAYLDIKCLRGRANGQLTFLRRSKTSYTVTEIHENDRPEESGLELTEVLKRYDFAQLRFLGDLPSNLRTFQALVYIDTEPFHNDEIIGYLRSKFTRGWIIAV